MSCADVCIDMDYDSDETKFSRFIMRTARKVHECCECKGQIKPGDRYEYACGLDDYSFWEAKTRPTCYEIRRALVCGSWIYGMLWDEIGEVVFPEWKNSSPIDCLAKIESLDARNKLRERYADWLEN